ncbi:MAG: hypothetical protein ACLRFI_03985 [Alphaproteobacteria bacterium]
MEKITNKDYITVNADGIFVGGKLATEYRGKTLIPVYLYLFKEYFLYLQQQKPNISSVHIMSSETAGNYAKTGKPSSKHGMYAWCRVKYKDRTMGNWVFVNEVRSAAYYLSVMVCLRSDADLRAAVLESEKDKTNFQEQIQDLDKRIATARKTLETLEQQRKMLLEQQKIR